MSARPAITRWCNGSEMGLFIFRGLGLVDTRLKGWFGFHGVLFGLIPG